MIRIFGHYLRREALLKMLFDVGFLLLVMAGIDLMQNREADAADGKSRLEARPPPQTLLPCGCEWYCTRSSCFRPSLKHGGSTESRPSCIRAQG